MTSPLCVATGGWCRRVFHYRPPTPMYRNSPPLCTIVLQIPSLMPLKMRKVQLSAQDRGAAAGQMANLSVLTALDTARRLFIEANTAPRPQPLDPVLQQAAKWRCTSQPSTATRSAPPWTTSPHRDPQEAHPPCPHNQPPIKFCGKPGFINPGKRPALLGQSLARAVPGRTAPKITPTGHHPGRVLRNGEKIRLTPATPRRLRHINPGT